MQNFLLLLELHPLWVWLALAGVLLALEAVTNSGYLLWPAASAVVLAPLSLVIASAPLQFVIFGVLTIATTFLARRYLPSPLRRKGPDINAPGHRIVGQKGRATTPFHGGSGRVLVEGTEWPAHLMGAEDAASASVMVVESIHGSTLTVRLAPSEPQPPFAQA